MGLRARLWLAFQGRIISMACRAALSLNSSEYIRGMVSNPLRKFDRNQTQYASLLLG